METVFSHKGLPLYTPNCSKVVIEKSKKAKSKKLNKN